MASSRKNSAAAHRTQRESKTDAPAGRPMVEEGIRDNHGRGKAGDFLRASLAPGSSLSVVAAYFTVPAYTELRAELAELVRVRFLYGDPTSVAYIDPEKKSAKSFNLQESKFKLSDQLKLRAENMACLEWVRRPAVEIRSARSKARLIHGKLYHVEREGESVALVGSSNFTARGLGFAQSPNVELNVVVDRESQRDALKRWFDDLWKDSVDCKPEVIESLQRAYEDKSPEVVYLKTLFHLFEHLLDEQADADALFQRTEIIDTDIWRALFDFQRDGVKGAIRKIQTFNGCILADSVGLGKTYSALAVIKYFELRNHRVLVLCPKKLRDNWTVYLAQNNSDANPFVKDRFAYTVLSHTDLSRDRGDVDGVKLESLNWGNFDLVVIDESHNFRNDAKGARDENGEIRRKSRYQRLMEDILQSGVKTKVMLLSATPVNNDLKDLRNQIYLVTEGRDSLGIDPRSEGATGNDPWIPSIKDTLALAQRVFTEWAKNSHERDVRVLLEKLPPRLFTLLDAVTIARSRKHLQRFYQDTMKKIGAFPKRLPPESVVSDIDTRGDFPSYDAIHDAIENFKLSLYNPSAYVKDEYKDQYLKERFRQQNLPGFSQANHERFLIGMMKVNYLKRLESSVNSFGVTMERTTKKIADLEAKIARFKSSAAKGETVNVALDDDALDDDETAEAFEVGGKLKYKLEHLRVDDWLKALAEDRERVAGLAQRARQIDAKRDAKLATLWHLVADKARNPTRDREGKANRKAIVFCAFADTARYLYDYFEGRRQEIGVHVALVSGGAGGNRSTLGRADYAEILTHFSPRSKGRVKMGPKMQLHEEIDLLIATDCISEGQNLQDCDLLINYDIHWNPVRIIQRFGRIDRLGSVHDAVRLVNFWPTEDLNRYINLKNRVEARMALVDLTATAEDNLLQTEEIRELIDHDLRYRDKQLARLKTEVLDLEDFNESVSLTEFSLDDFRMDLLNYLKDRKDALANEPLGLYAVVPPRSEVEAAKPGVIFCLRRRLDGDDTDKAKAENVGINPLFPYFLVYVRDDGEVRYNFTHAKQVLDLFRGLCLGKKQAYETLCRLFDEDTKHGADMQCYEGLLAKSTDAILNRATERNRSSLFARNGKVADAAHQVKSEDDFDLVTWLVILDETERHAA